MSISGDGVQIRKAEMTDVDEVSQLIADFRVTLLRFRGISAEGDVESARKEFMEYMEKEYPIYVATEDSKIVGYLVCRIEDDVVWAESLYVVLEYRRKGIGSKLYEKAEEIAEKLGQDTVYNWVHPNNHAIIQFLKKRGYGVLNLIEIRKRWKGEEPKTKIKVGENEFEH
jgi:ribosomal protein S18 acetylase RimI-like enzyme